MLKLKEIFDNSDQNIGVYYTRTDDSNPTFDQRVQLANKSDADLFISIHNNSTRSGRMSGTSGTQVMYDETSEASRQFAQICLEEVTGRIGSRDKGLVEGDSIYIIRTSKVPVALIEVGFMTNKDELEKLNSDAYQRRRQRASIRQCFAHLKKDTKRGQSHENNFCHRQCGKMREIREIMSDMDMEICSMKEAGISWILRRTARRSRRMRRSRRRR